MKMETSNTAGITAKSVEVSIAISEKGRDNPALLKTRADEFELMLSKACKKCEELGVMEAMPMSLLSWWWQRKGLTTVEPNAEDLSVEQLEELLEDQLAEKLVPAEERKIPANPDGLCRFDGEQVEWADGSVEKHGGAANPHGAAGDNTLPDSGVPVDRAIDADLKRLGLTEDPDPEPALRKVSVALLPEEVLRRNCELRKIVEERMAATTGRPNAGAIGQTQAYRDVIGLLDMLQIGAPIP